MTDTDKLKRAMETVMSAELEEEVQAQADPEWYRKHQPYVPPADARFNHGEAGLAIDDVTQPDPSDGHGMAAVALASRERMIKDLERKMGDLQILRGQMQSQHRDLMAAIDENIEEIGAVQRALSVLKGAE